ncbi:MAG: HAD family hydrolase [Sulfurospirillaceae bacterium]|nr:HAD family hydrolase [Sulfurospirillaceae bacterium]MDD3462515.1 HAD family hydrolase [Sulfurospirillaceae bacterium]
MKTILFDLDGTLIDSTDAILESFGVAYETFGHAAPDDKEVKALIGYPLDIMFATLGVKESEVDSYVMAYKEYYRLISRKKTTLLPLALEAIKEASRGAKLGVVTTKTARYSQELLEHFGVMDYFEVLIGRESVQNPKPHPEPILKAMSVMGALPNSTWMIGDTVLDLISAKEAKIKSVAVLCGYGKKSELELHTRHITHNTLDAVKFILQLSL